MHHLNKQKGNRGEVFGQTPAEFAEEHSARKASRLVRCGRHPIGVCSGVEGGGSRMSVWVAEWAVVVLQLAGVARRYVRAS
jgi:hypothetical protein